MLNLKNMYNLKSWMKRGSQLKKMIIITLLATTTTTTIIIIIIVIITRTNIITIETFITQRVIKRIRSIGSTR
jgi:hypothetical protein